ncbi:DUF1963 domain-containing protein [Ottowia sp.]|uniref:DUF1963 domain-containing protein n=1 Tax=Ottowia sp. TaxID=1898956 RepID=UPI003A884BAB
MNKEELINQINTYFPEQVLDLVKSLVVASVGFVPIPEDSSPGSSRFGGLPDLPPAIEWPFRPKTDATRLAELGGSSHRKHILRHLEQPLPLSFVAQIDLAEARRLGNVTASLPDSGRLLFFYDMALGPWDDSPQTARVIWDRSPVAELGKAKLPQRLRDLETQARQEYIETMKQSGLTPEADVNFGYLAPARPMRLMEQWSLQSLATAEATELGDFDEIDAGDGDEPLSLYDHYSSFDPEEAKQSEESFGYHGHRLLGLPDPEQDDPRYVPAFNDFLAGRPESNELRENFFSNTSARALKWHLLLQVDVALWLQTLGEGTVYFLIHEDDLKNRHFDRVWAVYQQT